MGENNDLSYLKAHYQKTFSGDAEKTKADEAKKRVQGHAPPLSPKGGEAKQGPTPKPRGAGS